MLENSYLWHLIGTVYGQEQKQRHSDMAHLLARVQIFKLLKNTGLNPEKCTRSLFLPPFADKLPEAVSNQIEIVGEHLLQLLGGVLIVEATKMVYAEPKKNRATTKARLFAPVISQSAYSSSE